MSAHLPNLHITSCLGESEIMMYIRLANGNIEQAQKMAVKEFMSQYEFADDSVKLHVLHNPLRWEIKYEMRID